MYLLTGLIYAFFMTQAVLYTATGALMPGLIADFAMTPSQVGYLGSVAAIGQLAANMTGGLVSDRLGKHRLYIAGALLAAATTLWQSGLALYLPFLAVSFLAGMGRAMTNLTGNALVADLHPARRGLWVGLLHVIFGLGALLGPQIGAAFVAAGLTWRPVYSATAGAQGLLVLLLLVSVRLIQPERLAAPLPAPGATPAGFSLRPVVLIALGMAFYTSSQLAIVTWYPTYIQLGLGQPPAIAATSLTFFWIGMVGGRLLTLWTADRFEGRRVLLIYTGLGALFTVMTALVRDPALILTAALLAGLLTGGTWPQALAYVYRAMPHATGRVTGIITVATGIAAIALPVLTGWAAEVAGLAAAVWSAACYLAVACACFALAPRQV
jgi:MFS transporter, FHS family, glucose/mannose:H+ symporter